MSASYGAKADSYKRMIWAKEDWVVGDRRKKFNIFLCNDSDIAIYRYKL